MTSIGVVIYNHEHETVLMFKQLLLKGCCFVIVILLLLHIVSHVSQVRGYARCGGCLQREALVQQPRNFEH